MKRSAIGLFLLLGWSNAMFGQLQLARQVVGSVGVSGSTSTLQMSSTCGEPAVSAYESASFTLTEGFQQPAFSPLEVQIVVDFEACWNGANATINFPLLAGCGGVEMIFLNGEEASFSIPDLEPGEYLIEVVAVGGCNYTELVIIEAPNLPPCDLNVYNVITPNGDGENDVFTIGNILHPSYRDNKVKILNRWGMLVWEGERYDNTSVAWDGRDKDGNMLPSGTYYYEIALNGQSFTGFITLLP